MSQDQRTFIELDMRPLPEVDVTLVCPLCEKPLYRSRQRIANRRIHFHDPKRAVHPPIGCPNDSTAYIVDAQLQVKRVDVEEV